MTAPTPLSSEIKVQGINQKALVELLGNLVTRANEDTTLVNAIRNQRLNMALGNAGLAIGGTTTSYKHTTQIAFVEAGIIKTSATTADHAFTAANVITANLWGVFLVSLAGTTWKTTPAATTMAYASEALAIAAMPAVPANEAVIGYITVQARTAVNFTANTTTLTADNGSGNSQTVNYYNGGFAQMQGMTVLNSTSLTLLKG